MKKKERAKKKGFSKLRAGFEDGDVQATARLREHVVRRLNKGWNVKTVATKLGLETGQVWQWLPDRRTPCDAAPRLVREKKGENA